MTDAPLTFHPIADLFPLLTGAEFDALVADIKINRLREPITRYEGMILDGRNRYRACLKAKVKPAFEQFKGDEAAATSFVVSRNIHRRHLKPKEKRDLLEKLLKADPQKSNRQIAKATGVSHPHIAKVRKELEKAGDVETVTTSIDTRGRKQPAKKAKPGRKDTTKKKKPWKPMSLRARRQVGPSAPGFIHRWDAKREVEERAERLAADARYAGDLVTHNREAASWLLRVLQDDDRREIVETSLATALRNTITATPTPMGNAENTATGNDTDPAESAETRKAQYAATEDGGETPAAAEIQPAAPEIPPTAPEIPPAESLLRGYADPGPIPEGLLREPAAPAPSRTSQAAK